jgi:ribonucleoside-diphosphate reductase alpha chain/ribonucleoside-triphosphate reductase
MIDAKTDLYKQVNGEWVVDKNIIHRQMSNNTIFYEEKPTKEQLHWQIQKMRYNGEPAFSNMKAVRERKSDAEGGNPCMEIILKNSQVCNLSEVNVMAFVENGKLNYAELMEAQKISAKIGYRMSLVEFELHNWNQSNKDDRLIGCSLTGWQDAMNALKYDKEKQKSLLRDLREAAIQSADELADRLGENRPALHTTCKPSGTISQLPTVSNGIHFSHSPYYIRRVRINADDPLVKVCEELEYPIFPEVGQDEKTCTTKVIEFPVKAPDGTTKYDISAIEQLEIYKMFMENYVEHNASITVHVRDDEWKDVEEWMDKNWDSVIAVSFVSLDDSYYELMPYESITEEEYNERVNNMKKFNPSLLQKYEKIETELDIGDESCEGNVCPIR